MAVLVQVASIKLGIDAGTKLLVGNSPSELKIHYVV